MIITLTNGDRVELKFTMKILKFLEEYKGGYKQLQKDIKTQNNLYELTSIVIYAFLRANYKKPITIDEAEELVDVKDLNKIVDFFYKELGEQEEYSKKKSKYTHHKKNWRR